jgi:tetratricopeptide (TPR) repeat protein
MAVSAAKAFGLYLRTLRNRAGLSLQEVEDLARNTPGPISKNYLSRCENGQLGLALSKMTILCKIYSVPSDVVLERMELDLELEQIGGPDTENMSYEELIHLGVKSIEGGDYWPGYACYREAVPLAPSGKLSPSFKDHQEQTQIAELNCATAAMRVGKNRFAVFEFRRIETTDHLSPTNVCFLYNRMANASRFAGNHSNARTYSDLAIQQATEIGDDRNLPYYLMNRAFIAVDEADASLAISHGQKAQRLGKRNGDRRVSVDCLNILGSAYLIQNRLTAARKAFSYELEEATELNNNRVIGFILLNFGKLEDKCGHASQAANYWRNAKRKARNAGRKLLSFQADLCLLEQAIRLELEPQRRNAQRRLARLAPFLPQSIDEIATYKALTKS